MRKKLLSYGEISALCTELAMFFRAGVPAGTALELIAENTPKGKTKDALMEMGDRVDGGKPLYRAFEDSGIIPEDVTSLLKVANEMGKTEVCLATVARNYEALDECDSRLRLAVVYPFGIMTAMLAVALFLTVYVLPVFARVYASFGAELSGFAAAVYAFGAFIKPAFIPLCVILAAVPAALVVFCRSQRFRQLSFGITKKDGRLFKKLAAARFANALELCISGGMGAEAAVAQAMKAVSNEKNKASFEDCLDMMKNGKEPWDAIAETGLLPKSQCRLLSLGAVGGTLDEACRKVSEKTYADLDHALSALGAGAEPAAVIICCVLIGAILASVMLPLVQIISLVG